MGRLVDARGLRCPWPALRLARTMRETPPGNDVEMRADDPKAEQEITALCAANGWLLRISEKDGGRIFTIMR